MKTITLLLAITLTSCATIKPVESDKPKGKNVKQFATKVIDPSAILSNVLTNLVFIPFL